MQYMAHIDFDESAQKKGSAELLVLAQLEGRPRHGYEIGLEIERRSEGAVSFQTASLYPVLYRLERKGFIAGQGVEAAGHIPPTYFTQNSPGPQKPWGQAKDRGSFLDSVQPAAGFSNS